jgi:hypothetical protein
MHDKGKTNSEIDIQKGIFVLFKIAGEYIRKISVAKIGYIIPKVKLPVLAKTVKK